MIPSDVVTEIESKPPTSSEEAEAILQRILSLLATLEPPETHIPPTDVWKCLCGDVDDSIIETNRNEEWIVGFKLIGSVLRQYYDLFSPFEIHDIATQASVFCETTQGLYFTTCIMICCYALWKCPPRVKSRPKRWRSCIFETIRLSQRNLDSLGIYVLVGNIIPACTHVRNAIPEGTDTLHWLAAFQSSVVQIMSYCALKLVQNSDPKDRVELIEKLCDGVEHAMAGNFSIVLHARYFATDDLHTKPISHAKWIKLWMSGLVEDEDYERVSFVDTVVDPTPLSQLSFFWFEWSGRPQIFSKSHLWHLLFPSVSILLNADECIESKLHGFLLLQRLSSLIPKASLPAPSSRRPDHPVGTFQLLSNRIVNDVPSNHQAKKVTILPTGSQAFQMMKDLLSKYHPRDQVRFVEQLHAQCPNQGLKPKLLDLLRDLVTWDDMTALKMAWSFLNTRLHVLEEYIQSNQGFLRIMDVENLILESEDFVAIMGIFRVWHMMRKTPTGVPDLEARLAGIVQAVSHTISATQSLDVFRLGLLENATQLALDRHENGIMEED